MRVYPRDKKSVQGDVSSSLISVDQPFQAASSRASINVVRARINVETSESGPS